MTLTCSPGVRGSGAASFKKAILILSVNGSHQVDAGTATRRSLMPVASDTAAGVGDGLGSSGPAAGYSWYAGI